MPPVVERCHRKCQVGSSNPAWCKGGWPGREFSHRPLEHVLCGCQFRQVCGRPPRITTSTTLQLPTQESYEGHPTPALTADGPKVAQCDERSVEATTSSSSSSSLSPHDHLGTPTHPLTKKLPYPLIKEPPHMHTSPASKQICQCHKATCPRLP